MADDNLSDEVLIKEWAQGKRSSYEELVRRYTAMLYARCVRQLGPSDAEDACQAVFLVLLKRAEQAAARPVLASWLLSVCNNVIRKARSEKQRRHSREKLQDATMEEYAHINPANSSISEDALSCIDEVLMDLPEREREAIELHYLAGQSYAAISEKINAPVTTIASRVKRGLKRLHSSFNKRGIQISSAVLLSILTQAGHCSPPAAFMEQLAQMNYADHVLSQSVQWSQGAEHIAQASVSARKVMTSAAAVILVSALIFSLFEFSVLAETENTPDSSVHTSKIIREPVIQTTVTMTLLEYDDAMLNAEGYPKEGTTGTSLKSLSIPLFIMKAQVSDDLNPQLDPENSMLTTSYGGFDVPTYKTTRDILGSELALTRFKESKLEEEQANKGKHYSMFWDWDKQNWIIGCVKAEDVDVFIKSSKTSGPAKELFIEFDYDDKKLIPEALRSKPGAKIDGYFFNLTNAG